MSATGKLSQEKDIAFDALGITNYKTHRKKKKKKAAVQTASAFDLEEVGRKSTQVGIRQLA